MPALPVDKIQPERILKELGRLWVDLGKQDEHGVLRACAMTLIVLLEDNEDAADAGELIAALMHEHPSRAIVVRVSQSQQSDLSAQVLAQCWMPFGRRQQICCEQIEIRASRLVDFNDLPSILSGLLVPDLPVALYCPSANLWHAEELRTLLPFTTKLVVDTSRDENVQASFQHLQELMQSAHLVGDLSWARVTRWRQAVAQVFDESICREAIPRLNEISIRYTGERPSTMALLFASWLRSVLGERVAIRLDRLSGAGCEGLKSAEFKCQELSASVTMLTKDTVELRIGDRTRRMVFPESTTYDALRQELTILSDDPAFDRALRYANELR